MELRQLKYFVKAAETLNFSDAAKSLFIAQSTLSQQIRQLEDDLHTELFHRDAHSLCLTEAGEELLPYARKTLQEAEACVERMNDLSNLLTGTLNIGVTFSFSPLLTETILSFIRKYPNVKLNIFYEPMAELMGMLRNRTVDFVLAFRPIERCREIESHTLFDNHLAVIVKENHPIASLPRVSPEELLRYDIALPSKGLQARNEFDGFAFPSLSSLKVKVELNEVNILLKLIKQSNMVTVLAEATAYNETGIKAVPLDLPSNQMDGCVHMLKDSYHKHSAIRFIELLKESNAVRERIHDWFK